jgi:SAM-dependent methyltransferase
MRKETEMTTDLPDHVLQNRSAWDHMADDYARRAPQAWSQDEPAWGEYNIPDTDIHALPADVSGMDVIDLGCGTGYFCAWLAKKGAKPVGIDNSPRQLETARQMQQQFGIDFPLHLGNAERLPFPGESFDLAISEYGASIWCDPYKWIPEAARVLRPGGRLVFLVNGPLIMLCSLPEDSDTTPVREQLMRPWFGMHRFEWDDDEGVEFHLNHGDMIRLLRKTGFEIEQLIEIQAPEGTDRRIAYVPYEWARKWPAEEIWCARKRSR